MADPAPLVATPEAPIPPGGAAEWFEGVGGKRLRAALFPTGKPAKGTVIVSPGRTEPIEKYFETVGDLTDRGWSVLVHDWRGQGLSTRLLKNRLAGHAVGYADFLSDYARLIGAFEARLPRPWIALGHSMGGCLTLLALATSERRVSGAILSAPMLGLAVGSLPPLLVGLAARAQRNLGLGGRPIARPGVEDERFETNILTHDRRRYERNQAQVTAAPDLALGPPTWGWLDFAFSAIGVLRNGRGVTAISMPVSVIIAGEEKLVDNAGARKVTARIPRGRLVEIPGAYHEILQETDPVRAAFFAEFDALAARVAG